MMWSKGFAAEETKAAFARAAELAGRTDDFSERFTALQGQWVGGVTARRIAFCARAGRDASCAKRRMRDGSRKPASPIAWLGLVAYWHGDFVEARTHLRAGARRSRPEPRRRSRERFGRRRHLARSSILAATMWQLGEVERARELIDCGNPARVRARPHPVDRRCALLEIVSGNLAWRPLGDAERGRGSGARRARTRDDAVSQRGRTAFRLGAGSDR